MDFHRAGEKPHMQLSVLPANCQCAKIDDAGRRRLWNQQTVENLIAEGDFRSIRRQKNNYIVSFTTIY